MFSLLVASTLAAGAPFSEKVPLPKLPHAPLTYLCQRATTVPVIDGKLDDAVWQKAAWTADFVDIEGSAKPRPRHRTRVKMAWDDQYFYFAAELEEPHVWAKLTQRDSVIFQDNDFEIFLDPDGTTHPYYEFEINALNTVWDLLLRKPYRDAARVAVNAWDMPGLKTAVHVDGTLNNPTDTDKGWTVEVAIPWKAVTEISRRAGAPAPGDQWRVNFSRVQWRTQVVDGQTVKVKGPDRRDLPEDNWVWSPQGIIAMHYPEMWGVVQFSADPAGAPVKPVVLKPEEDAKWALRQVYYAQRNFHAEKGFYAKTLKALGLGALKAKGYGPVILEAGRLTWAAELSSPEGHPKVSINAEGATAVHLKR